MLCSVRDKTLYSNKYCRFEKENPSTSLHCIVCIIAFYVNFYSRSNEEPIVMPDGHHHIRPAAQGSLGKRSVQLVIMSSNNQERNKPISSY